MKYYFYFQTNLEINLNGNLTNSQFKFQKQCILIFLFKVIENNVNSNLQDYEIKMTLYHIMLLIQEEMIRYNHINFQISQLYFDNQDQIFKSNITSAYKQSIYQKFQNFKIYYGIQPETNHFQQGTKTLTFLVELLLIIEEKLVEI
ncbi:unnamed protein product [Paramecium sonneborni]|uniref:Uncharacterized protein n=1 Tax=Paramecium sonneborni TaxID=65129 RepID=A0A8S1PIF9_9CILI|nr:unnamed protein product [Paramecium sonneborni]